MTDSDPSTAPTAAVGVIGGSGLYALFAEGSAVSLDVQTPYGPPSGAVTIGELGGVRVAFLPRHGSGHSVPPHRINYRANVWALASLGVSAILSSAAVGGVSPDYPTGSLVLPDQLLDRTSGRRDTFFDDADVQHLPAADPFDPALLAIGTAALDELGEKFLPRGTVVVIQGPRFSTRAESLWHRGAGAHIVNMTLAPEVFLAAELGIGTLNLSFVTDADAGIENGGEAVTAELVFARLAEAQPRIVRAIEHIIRSIPANYAPRQLIAAEAVTRILEQPVAAS